MNIQVLRDAYREAVQGREDILADMEALQVKEKHLSAAIESLRLAIGDNVGSVPVLTSLPAAVPVLREADLDAVVSFEDRRLWEVARDMLAEKNVPMTVPEMMAILTPQGYKIQGDGLRVAMIRRSDIFYKTGYGRYGLTSWPSANIDVEPTTLVPETKQSSGEHLHRNVIPDNAYMSHSLATDSNRV